MEEIAKGLLQSGRPFLWVIREKQNNEEENEEDKLSYGGIRYNRTMVFATRESIICGIPVIAFPQWIDQGTNAKLLEDVWKIGVRVREREEDGIVESNEIKRCIELVMEKDGKKGLN
ncbi:hypothetical protein M9H77_30953 [Catharanthus roseus]|uniref:Uncharacterized protein n=1 Tax=Catharanthus roseus TaxID=4058 RepID=A0ACB9ZZN3_CATRO|nr:hypothetical protein M9H77_30953 [Catharanthus roseus]